MSLEAVAARIKAQQEEAEQHARALTKAIEAVAQFVCNNESELRDALQAQGQGEVVQGQGEVVQELDEVMARWKAESQRFLSNPAVWEGGA